MMIQAFLEIFTTEQKAEAMLANPVIEFIFMALLFTFMITVIVHFVLFVKLRSIRNYLQETKRMDIEPIKSFKQQFDEQQTSRSVHVETFVQEKFSSWRMFNIPVVNLIKMVQATISIFILIGVLGTFIGLTISLGSINSAGDQLVENVANVLSGIDVAFYTSIVGMGFSLLMTVLVKVFNTEYMLTDMMLMVESNLVRDEQEGMGRLIDVSETMNESILSLQATNQDSLQRIVQAFAGFQEYTTGLQKSAEDLATFNEGLSHNLDDFQELFQQMKMVTDGFGKGTTELNKNFASLFTYFKKTDRKNERMAEAFEQTTQKSQEVAQTQIDSLQQFAESVDEFKDFTDSFLEEQAGSQRMLSQIMQQGDELVGTMGKHNATFKQVFGSDLSMKIGQVNTNVSELATGFNQLGSSIVKLPEALDVINETQTTHKDLLVDRFQELKEFNVLFSNHLKDHATEAATFEKLVRDASSSYEQMGKANNDLIREINQVLSQMGQKFNQREQQLESSVGILKDTLANYMTQVEGTFGLKLDQVIRQIGDSMEQTSGDIKREFMEIRQIVADRQQSQSRSVERLLQEVGRELHALNRNLSTLSQQPIPIDRQVGWNQNES